MLTPKNDGPGDDSLRDGFSRGTDEPGGVSRKKPLSQRLREEREHKHLSQQEVAKLTHIPLNYLQLLEGEEDGRVVSDSMYLIASLRSYADFLEIDQGAVLTQFIAELDQGRPAKEIAGNAARPTRARKRFSQQWSRAMRRTVLLLVLPLGMLAVIGYYSELPQGPRPEDNKVAPLPAPAHSLPPPQSELPPPVASPALSASPADAGRSEPSSPSPAVSPAVAAAPQAEPPLGSTPQVEPPVENASPQGQPPPGRSPHRLRVQAKEPTWLRVIIDDQPAKETLLRPGQVVEWSAEAGFTLTLGNAGGVAVTLDGQRVPPVGKSGQVIRNLRLPSQERQVRSSEQPLAAQPRAPRHIER
jgi:cytoskeleton protein RodZ